GHLPVELVDARHPDEDGRAGAAVAVMLRQVQDQAVPGYLHVGRGVLLEVVLPIDREAKVIDVELLRLLHAEDAQDGDRLLERHRHRRPPASASKVSANASVPPLHSFLSLNTLPAIMLGPYLTTSADTRGGGGAGRSARRAASRGGRTTA